MVTNLALRKAADPALKAQLSHASSPEAPIRVVLTLGKPKADLQPSEVRQLADEVVERACKRTGDQGEIVNVLAYLHSATIVGTVRLITEILKQPEVISAMAASQPGLGLIKPVKYTQRVRE